MIDAGDEEHQRRGPAVLVALVLLGVAASSCRGRLLTVSVSRSEAISDQAAVSVWFNKIRQEKPLDQIPVSPNSRTFGYELDRDYPTMSVTLKLEGAGSEYDTSCDLTWNGPRITWVLGGKDRCPRYEMDADGGGMGNGGTGGRSATGGATGGFAGSAGDTAGTGGLALATGGNNGTGGGAPTATGGISGTGGRTGSGGSPVSTGGVSATGGRAATGGATAASAGGATSTTGGSGGGGPPGSGGAIATGGTAGMFGSTGSGGAAAVSTGGVVGTGGIANGSGGAPATGGTPGTGGGAGGFGIGDIGACLSTASCSCSDYCRSLTLSCGAVNYFPESDCEDTCASFHWDTSLLDRPANSTGCRVRRLAGQAGDRCSTGSPNGGDWCGGSRCIVYCQAFLRNCPGTTKWNETSCRNACATFPWTDDPPMVSGAKLARTGFRGGCFLYWAGQAGRANAPVDACANASPDSAVCLQ